MTFSPAAYADHPTASVSIPSGTAVPGCDETNECYIPADVTVDVGGEVQWSNDDTAAHTVTSGTAETGPTDLFDSGLLIAGSTFSTTLDEEGEIPYYCIVHPWMVGTITVSSEHMDDTMTDDTMMDDTMMDDTMMDDAMMDDAMMDNTMDDTMMDDTMIDDTMTDEIMEDTMMDDTMMDDAMTDDAMMDDTMMDDTMTDDTMMDDTMTDDAMMDDTMMDDAEENAEGGGCLIATAAYGSELAPQVQLLREVRDNTLLSTESGSSFMSGFNTLYYSFSPAVADLERESPVFREAVKLFITPMLSSLSIMTLADAGSEYQVLGLGMSVIALNLGMYIAAPAIAVWQIKKRTV